MCLVSVKNQDLYMIGGQTGPEDQDVLNTIYLSSNKQAWTKVAEMTFTRKNCNVIVNGDKLFIFGGYCGKYKFCTTKIEIFDIPSKTLNAAEYRLPQGVEGASLAWHEDKLLLVGGRRFDKPSNEVLMLDFETKSMLSLRYNNFYDFKKYEQ